MVSPAEAAPGNAAPLELARGDVVAMSGLKAAAELNGQEAVLWKLDDASGRWEVKLSDGTVKALKPANLTFRSIGPVEDDGTLMLIGMATDNKAVHAMLKYLEGCLPQASESMQLVSSVLHPSCGGAAKGEDAAIWVKLGHQAEGKAQQVLEDLQKHLEALDSIDLAKLSNKSKEELKVARRDLVKFVQGVQERLESTLTRLKPAKARLLAEVPVKNHGGNTDGNDEAPLHEKYREVFAPKEEVKAAVTQDAAAKAPLQKIIVKYQGKGENPPPTDNLYVKNLPGWITEADITAIFNGTGGEVQSQKLKVADWGGICFVRLKDKKEAAKAIQDLNGKVPPRLAMKHAEQEAKKLGDAIARTRLQALVTQLEKGVVFTMDLTAPLGIVFNDRLRASEVTVGMQAYELGIRSGWRARSIGGTVVETTEGLVGKIKSLKQEGFKEAAVAFSPPAHVATFDRKPLGLVIRKDPEFGLITVAHVTEPAVSLGVKAGAVLTKVERQDVSDMEEDEISEALKNVTFPVTLFFEQVYAAPKKTSGGRGAGPALEPSADVDTGPRASGSWRLAKGTPVTVDLSKPLGIFFDDMLVAKDVEEGSQAAGLGISAGWRARSVAGEAVQMTDAFIEKIMALKAKQTASVQVAFSPPPLVAKLDERPFGFNINLDETLGLFIVTVASEKAASKGVKVGTAVTRVNGTDTNNLSFPKLCQLLGQASLPATVIFESFSADESKEQSGQDTRKRAAPVSDSSASAPAKKIKSEVRLDLSQPLGIFFDKECCAKGVQADSQAAKSGIAEGWRALSVDDTAVQLTKELVGRIKVLKEQGASHACISFSHPATASASSADAAGGSANGSAVASEPGSKTEEVKSMDFDLSKPLGINFFGKLVAKSVQEGSQAEAAGICSGWRALSVGSETVQTTKELVGRIKLLKDQGVPHTTISFACPPAPANPAAPAPAASLPDAPSAPTQDVKLAKASSELDSLMQDVGAATESAAPSAGKSGAVVAGPQEKHVSFDLSLPLGINFDAKVVAKGVQADSQAERAGVCSGWQAISIGSSASGWRPVQSTKDLVARVKVLKAEGVTKTTIVFILSAESAQSVPEELAKDVKPATASSEPQSLRQDAATDPEPPAGNHAAEAAEPAQPQEHHVSFDLSLPLGVNFDAKLVAKGVQADSQAERAGICSGWKVLLMGSSGSGWRPMQSTKDLVARVKALKAEGVNSTTIVFISSAEEAQSVPEDPASSVGTPAEAPAPSADNGSAAAVPQTSAEESQKSISFDLSKSLGINFDAKLSIKSVQDGSQAAESGVSTGWRALSVGSVAVQTTKELVANIESLKSEGVAHVSVTFAREKDPAESPKRDPEVSEGGDGAPRKRQRRGWD